MILAKLIRFNKSLGLAFCLMCSRSSADIRCDSRQTSGFAHGIVRLQFFRLSWWWTIKRCSKCYINLKMLYPFANSVLRQLINISFIISGHLFSHSFALPSKPFHLAQQFGSKRPMPPMHRFNSLPVLYFASVGLLPNHFFLIISYFNTSIIN